MLLFFLQHFLCLIETFIKLAFAVQKIVIISSRKSHKFSSSLAAFSFNTLSLTPDF